MEKVAGSYYSTAMIPSSVNTGGSGSSLGSIERSSAVRGHHSGVTKAVEAHRMMVEERQSRKTRGFGPSATADNYETQQPNDFVVAQQVTQSSSEAEANSDMYENTLIEPVASQAKMASVQAFQSQEPDRPFMGEPVPKGSYLDVEG